MTNVTKSRPNAGTVTFTDGAMLNLFHCSRAASRLSCSVPGRMTAFRRYVAYMLCALSRTVGNSYELTSANLMYSYIYSVHY